MIDGPASTDRDPDDVSRKQTPEQLERMAAVHSAAAKLAEAELSRMLGAELLAGLAADSEGEAIVRVALKAKRVSVCIRWPAFAEGTVTVCELSTHADLATAN